MLPSGNVPGQSQDGVAAKASASAVYGNVIPFRRRFVAAMHRSPIGQIMLQPRLAMTAAMAFLSIALTMDLTGIHPLSLRASDLTPSSLKRDFYSNKARVARYYDGLRVVYELESRVHDLQSASDNDTPQSAPSSTSPAPAAQPDQTGPAKQSPSSKPEQKQSPSGSGPHSGPASSRPTPNSSTSQRESVRQQMQMASLENSNSFIVRMHENLEGGLA
jgi:hypothetical protein